MREQVAQQCHLGTVVQHLPVDVQHQLGHRVLGEGALRRTALPGQTCRAKASDAIGPRRVQPVKLGQGTVGRAG